MGQAWKQRRNSSRAKLKAKAKKLKKKQKKKKRKSTSRSLRVAKLKQDEENQLLYAVEKALKIYGAALASSIFIGVLVYLYSLLPWTKWDAKDGVPRYNVPLFVSPRAFVTHEHANSHRVCQPSVTPQVGFHTAVQVFIYPIHGALNVASYSKLPHSPGTRGWGWDIAGKGTYVGWAVTGIIKYGLVFILPFQLGVDPRFYFLGEYPKADPLYDELMKLTEVPFALRSPEHATGHFFVVFEYAAVVTWMNYLQPENLQADTDFYATARESLRRDSMVATALIPRGSKSRAAVEATNTQMENDEGALAEGKYNNETGSSDSLLYKIQDATAWTIFYILSLGRKSFPMLHTMSTMANLSSITYQHKCQLSSSESTVPTTSTTFTGLWRSASFCHCLRSSFRCMLELLTTGVVIVRETSSMHHW